MKSVVRWSNGIAVRYRETKLLFDALESDSSIPDLFITHAHLYHARGFGFPAHKKYSTQASRELYEAATGNQVGNWREIRTGQRLKLGQVELEAHNAGHVLGSVQYAIITPEETIVYASHLNPIDTLLNKAAEVAPCDVLVLEAPFNLQLLPPREAIFAEIIQWSLDMVKEHRIPAIEVDTLGSAQELVKLFNTWTALPVLVHTKIARMNRIYENNGLALKYVDASTEDAARIVEGRSCVVLMPRGFDSSRFGDFKVASVSGWAPRQQDGKQTFCLGDRGDLPQLLLYVQKVRPKVVLTFQGASRALAEIILKKTGIITKALTTQTIRRSIKAAGPKVDEKRVMKCQGIIMEAVQIRNFIYEKRDLVGLVLKQGFVLAEIEEALMQLTRSGVLKYSETVQGYSLA